MSSSCGNCDCADKSQCEKGNNYGVTIVETESFVETVVMPAVEHDCKCGSNCTCTNCTCGH
ncbi:metallothionein-like protein [Trifolium pratense]|uniref:Uncharacterized protein n=2 Tax=Trifolium pratense TaxID=57577 RepID=A0ACB0JKP4_TRIPR|nr:metallothionein-like protein [Trifolium pratense]CAJ2645439.1 unnamed protein product [Trifolium pratense]